VTEVKKDSSFFEKKEAKKLLFLRPRQDTGKCTIRGSSGETKVFLLLFFQKKKVLPSFLLHHNDR